MPKTRIVSFDIEATNLDADFGYTLCFAFKVLGEPSKVFSISDYELHKTEPWNDSRLLQDVREVIESSDILISYYGKGFDWGFLNARLLANGMDPLPEIPHVDLYWTARRVLKIQSRSMANVAEHLNLKDRKMYVPRKLWIMAQAAHVPSIEALAERCKSDTEVLEGAYLRLRGSVRLHPVVGDLGTCRFCGSPSLQRRGFQLTRTAKKQRVQCSDCAAWDTRKVDNRGEED